MQFGTLRMCVLNTPMYTPRYIAKGGSHCSLMLLIYFIVKLTLAKWTYHCRAFTKNYLSNKTFTSGKVTLYLPETVFTVFRLLFVFKQKSHIVFFNKLKNYRSSRLFLFSPIVLLNYLQTSAATYVL